MHQLSYYLIRDRFPSLLCCHFLSHLSHCLAFNANPTEHSNSLSPNMFPHHLFSWHATRLSSFLPSLNIFFYSVLFFQSLLFGQALWSFCMTTGNRLVPALPFLKPSSHPLFILSHTFILALTKKLCTTYSNVEHCYKHCFLVAYWSFSFMPLSLPSSAHETIATFLL